MNNDLLTPPLLRVQLITSHAECPGQYAHSRRSEGVGAVENFPL